jgi:hypothetical protein
VSSLGPNSSDPDTVGKPKDARYRKRGRTRRDRLKELKKQCDRGVLLGLVAFVFDGRETFFSVGGIPDDESLKRWFRIMQPYADGEAIEACE